MPHEPLQNARTAANLTQKEVAAGIGMDPGQYSRIENQKETITPKKAAEMATWFAGRGVTISEIELLYPERYAASPVAEVA